MPESDLKLEPRLRQAGFVVGAPPQPPPPPCVELTAVVDIYTESTDNLAVGQDTHTQICAEFHRVEVTWANRHRDCAPKGLAFISEETWNQHLDDKFVLRDLVRLSDESVEGLTLKQVGDAIRADQAESLAYLRQAALLYHDALQPKAKEFLQKFLAYQVKSSHWSEKQRAAVVAAMQRLEKLSQELAVDDDGEGVKGPHEQIGLLQNAVDDMKALTEAMGSLRAENARLKSQDKELGELLALGNEVDQLFGDIEDALSSVKDARLQQALGAHSILQEFRNCRDQLGQTILTEGQITALTAQIVEANQDIGLTAEDLATVTLREGVNPATGFDPTEEAQQARAWLFGQNGLSKLDNGNANGLGKGDGWFGNYIATAREEQQAYQALSGKVDALNAMLGPVLAPSYSGPNGKRFDFHTWWNGSVQADGLVVASSARQQLEQERRDVRDAIVATQAAIVSIAVYVEQMGWTSIDRLYRLTIEAKNGKQDSVNRFRQMMGIKEVETTRKQIELAERVLNALVQEQTKVSSWLKNNFAALRQDYLDVRHFAAVVSREQQETKREAVRAVRRGREERQLDRELRLAHNQGNESFGGFVYQRMIADEDPRVVPNGSLAKELLASYPIFDRIWAEVDMVKAKRKAVPAQ